MMYYIPIAVVLSWIVSHIIKELVHMHRTGKFSLYTLLMETGGMPSSHSASVSALVVALFLEEGVTTMLWVALFFAFIVIRDAFGVRKSVSDQAKVLNVLLSKAQLQQKVDIVLGHTPFQVVVGVILGVSVALILRISPLFSL